MPDPAAAPIPDEEFIGPSGALWGEAKELLVDCWNQFAYTNSRGEKITGGLSTLEWLDEFLDKIGADRGSIREWSIATSGHWR